MRHVLTVLSLAVLVVACGGTRDTAFVCPRVAAVAGLDRLEYAFQGAPRPVRAQLDVLEATCVPDGPDAFLVRSVIAIRLAPDRPAGEFRIPYSLAIDTPEGTELQWAEFAVIPNGSRGIVERYEHRVEGVGPTAGARVRLLYALTPDDAALQQIARDRPRGG
jgi:hypothetical protein